MLYTIYDLETTGLSKSTSEVCQCAILRVTQNLTPVEAHSYYFYHDGMHWTAGAERIHGLSRDFLKQYADQFDANLLHMYAALQRGNLVGYNSDAYDNELATSYLARCGLPYLQPAISYDVMNIWGKEFGHKLKLTELTEKLGYSPEMVSRLARHLFKEDGELGAHNACYDVTATYLCFQKAIQKGLCTLPFTQRAKAAAPVQLSI